MPDRTERGRMEQRMHKKFSPHYVIQLAQKMRKDMTASEKRLWLKLRNKQVGGLRFRKQHPIGRYIADFYCHELKLVIELDGTIHDERKEYDENRDTFLKAGEYTVLRFNNNEIEDSIDDVMDKIRACAELLG